MVLLVVRWFVFVFGGTTLTRSLHFYANTLKWCK